MKNEETKRRSIWTRAKEFIEQLSVKIDDGLNHPILLPDIQTNPTIDFTTHAIEGNQVRDVSSFRNPSGERTVTIRRRSPEASLTPRNDQRAVQKGLIVRKTKSSDSSSSDSMPSNLGGKRVSMENPSILAGGMETFSQFSRNDYWQSVTMSSRFNTDNFSKISISELAELLTELSPEVSAALWYYLICCNSGYTITVTKPGSDDKSPYVEAQAYLDSCLKTLGSYHGTLNTFFDKTFMCIFMRGSFLYELVLQANGKDFADVASPDTKTLNYRRIWDEIRGQIWDFGQYQSGKWVSLDIPTIRYVPLHPLPGRIEGRAMISPVFFTAIFLMSVLRDLKRVIQQQGYMRLDLEIIFEKLQKSIPEDAQNDPVVFKAWADKVTADVENFYAQLEPDDAYVHSDAVKVNNPVGTASANSLSAMDSLFGILERMAVRALKTLPALLGLQESGNNQGAENRKFEFYQKGNETIQRMVETAFGDECKLMLQAGGYQADVVVKFAQMRASEELRDLQIANLKSMVARSYYDNGWFSQDEAAKFATDKDAADNPEPRAAAPKPNGTINDIQTAQPDPGINRFFKQLEMVRAPTLSELSNAVDIWNENAPDNAKHLIEAGVYEPEQS